MFKHYTSFLLNIFYVAERAKKCVAFSQKYCGKAYLWEKKNRLRLRTISLKPSKNSLNNNWRTMAPVRTATAALVSLKCVPQCSPISAGQFPQPNSIYTFTRCSGYIFISLSTEKKCRTIEVKARCFFVCFIPLQKCWFMHLWLNRLATRYVYGKGVAQLRRPEETFCRIFIVTHILKTYKHTHKHHYLYIWVNNCTVFGYSNVRSCVRAKVTQAQIFGRHCTATTAFDCRSPSGC